MNEKTLTISDAAHHYIERLGWKAVTLKHQSKECINADWLTRKYKPSDFNFGHNIGIHFTNGLVDVDVDCDEAVRFALEILPKTKAIYGRRGRRKSHWLYVCPDAHRSLSLKDVVQGGKTIIELRVNHQSMAPPSIHPDGERVEWEKDLPESALKVEAKVLIRALRLIATGVMIARNYPPPGARHEWGLALAGCLKTYTITEHECRLITGIAGKIVEDGKVQDRFDAIRTTYMRGDDEPTQSTKVLQDAIGDNGKKFVESITKIWARPSGMSMSLVEKMNEKHAVLFHQSGKVVILTEHMESGHHQVRFTSRAHFNLLYPNMVQVGTKDAPDGKDSEGNKKFRQVAVMKPQGEAWVQHKKRRVYQGIELAPDGKGNEGYFNLWRGYSVEPKAGEWGYYRTLLSHLVKGNEDHLRYVLNWLAETIQHPERPIGVALTLKGKQGTGKGSFAKWIGRLFGTHYLHLDSDKRLLGSFNAHLHNKVVVFADEAVWAGGKAGLGALKRMITEESLDIERKGVDVIQVRNVLHMIIASNEDWVVPAAFDDRRFAIFEVSDDLLGDFEYFDLLHEQMEYGGLQAFLYDMLEFKRDLNLRILPNTEERGRQKHHTMDAKEMWWVDQLKSGEIWEDAETADQHPGDFMVSRDSVYDTFAVDVTKADKRANVGFKTSLGMFLKRVMPATYPREVRFNYKKVWAFPSLDVCRTFFEDKFDLAIEWEQVGDQEPRGDVDVPF